MSVCMHTHIYEILSGTDVWKSNTHDLSSLWEVHGSWRLEMTSWIPPQGGTIYTVIWEATGN